MRDAVLRHVVHGEIANSQADQSHEDLKVPTPGQIIFNIFAVGPFRTCSDGQSMSAHETVFTCSDSGIRVPATDHRRIATRVIAVLLQEGAQMRPPRAEASALLLGVCR